MAWCSPGESSDASWCNRRVSRASRVRIPGALRSSAAIDRETIAGADHVPVEISGPAYWAKVDTALDASAEQLASRRAELL